jgi:hypothetical protein
MGWPVHADRYLQAASLAALLAWLAPTAQAEEASYCVTCSNPNQTYRCRVVGEGAGANDAAKLYCIIRTAKEGHHSACSAERKTAANCPGVEKVYTYDGPSIPAEIASDPRVKSLSNRIERNQQAFAKPQSGGAPKTLFELGGRAVSASREGWRNARTKIGGSANDAQAPPSSGEPAPTLNAPAHTASIPPTAPASTPAPKSSAQAAPSAASHARACAACGLCSATAPMPRAARCNDNRLD